MDITGSWRGREVKREHRFGRFIPLDALLM